MAKSKGMNPKKPVKERAQSPTSVEGTHRTMGARDVCEAAQVSGMSWMKRTLDRGLSRGHRKAGLGGAPQEATQRRKEGAIDGLVGRTPDLASGRGDLVAMSESRLEWRCLSV
jgi:hypothetical protein